MAGRVSVPGPAGEVIVAVDIGPENLSAGLVTLQGELIDRDHIPVDHDVKADLLFARLRGLIESQMDLSLIHI